MGTICRIVNINSRLNFLFDFENSYKKLSNITLWIFMQQIWLVPILFIISGRRETELKRSNLIHLQKNKTNFSLKVLKHFWTDLQNSFWWNYCSNHNNPWRYSIQYLMHIWCNITTFKLKISMKMKHMFGKNLGKLSNKQGEEFH